MAILIIAVCFITIFLNLGVFFSASTSKREVLICSTLIFSLLVVFITELLSVFSLINYTSLSIAWGFITLANIVHLYTKNSAVTIFINELKNRISSVYNTLTRFEKFCLFSVLTILIFVFGQGVIYPPNNWDSMTYHLSRITSWISRGSVAHFPTHIFYQIYQGPFAEYTIMHFSLLARGDYFAFAVQFYALLNILIVLTLIVKALGLPRRYQVMVIVLGATIPEVVLQASSTQNDVTAAFFIITAIYFAYKAANELKLKNYLFLGLAIGLAFLTKATAYLYMAPVMLIFGITILVKVFNTKNYKYLWYAFVAIFIIIGINSRQYYRNYCLSENVLGTPKTDLDSYNNKKMNALLFLSSVEKNAGLQMGILGSAKPAIYADSAIHKLHTAEGININSPDNNFTNSNYRVAVGEANHEDYASNLIHLILIIISCVIIAVHGLRNKKNWLVTLLFLTVLLQVSLFCGFLKWQVWNTRLHTPAFLISVPLICYAAFVSRFKAVINIIIPVILLYAFVIVLRNAVRPYIGVDANKHASIAEMLRPRYEKYFENRPYLYPEYNAVNDSIKRLNYKNIGLIIGTDDWQYPLFANCYAKEINPVHLNVKNVSKSVKNIFTNVDCIVSTKINKPFIDFNGRRFYNQDSQNKYLYFYK